MNIMIKTIVSAVFAAVIFLGSLWLVGIILMVVRLLSIR